MRVLFLFANQDEINLGGVAEVVNLLPPALQKEGVEVVLYNQSKHSFSINPETHSNGIRWYTGPFVKPAVFPSKKELAPVLAVCEKEKIDLVHAHGVYRAGFLALQIKKHLNIPYIITSHGDISPHNSKRMAKFSVKRRCRTILKNADAITHLSPFMANHAHQLIDARSKSVMIANGINTSEWAPFINQPEKNYLLAIGRLEREKGFGVLLAMFAELAKSGIQESLVIAGSGNMEAELQTMAQQLGLNVIIKPGEEILPMLLNNIVPPRSVIFTGYARNEIKKQLFSHAKIIYFATQLTGIEEAFGLVQLEAMAAKKVLIASDIPATRYLQTLGMQATLVSPTDVNAWVKATHSLLNNESERRALAAQNYQSVAQFDLAVIAKQYAQVYKTCLVKDDRG